MPRQNQRIFPLSIDGGVNTELGPSAPTLLRGDTLSVPYLINATNAIYNLDGWPQKMPGAARVNTNTTGATDDVMGIFDYWRSTASGNPVQRAVIYAGTQIYSWTPGATALVSIATGRVADGMPAFEVMNDVLVLAETSVTDVPATWNQTTFANLGGTPPNFSFHVQHKDRMWAAGVDTNKSRLYYSALSNQADWTGAGSGSIDIAPDDGDQITALRGHRNELIVFKGPSRGRIVRITGSAPTGADAFAQVPFVTGVGATNHQAVLPWRSDLIFWDQLGVHSFQATEVFGDYKEAFISDPISSYFNTQLNHNRFTFVWGLNYALKGYALWTVSRRGSSTNDLILLWDYRFNPPRWAFWPAYAAASLGLVLDASLEPTPWAGTYTGFVLRTNRPARNLGGTSYTFTMTAPYLSFGDPLTDKTLVGGRVGYQPKGDTTFTLAWTRDTNTQQTESLSQGGGPTLGASSDEFTLDTDTLGGGTYRHAFPTTMEGSFKELQLELSQGSLDVDVEPHGLALIVEGAGIGATATVG